MKSKEIIWKTEQKFNFRESEVKDESSNNFLTFAVKNKPKENDEVEE